MGSNEEKTAKIAVVLKKWLNDVIVTVHVNEILASLGLFICTVNISRATVALL